MSHLLAIFESVGLVCMPTFLRAHLLRRAVTVVGTVTEVAELFSSKATEKPVTLFPIIYLVDLQLCKTGESHRKTPGACLLYISDAADE